MPPDPEPQGTGKTPSPPGEGRGGGPLRHHRGGPHPNPLPGGEGTGNALLAFLLLMVASILFRLPPLLNARGVHSDSAIVGLQARHILRGEWSWYLWGDGQQSSFDGLMVALGFLIGGDNALTLMAVPLAGHLLMTWFLWDLLRRRLGVAAATVAALPIAIGPPAVAMVALYAPRQWCFTAAAAGFWLLDGAGRSRRPRPGYALGVGLVAAAVALDLIAAAFLPALLFFAPACCLDGGPGGRALRRRLAACAIGLAVGGSLVWLARQGGGSSTWKAGASLARVPRNGRLLRATCLPWTLSARVIIPGPVQKSLGPWTPPVAFRAVQAIGAGSLVLGILAGGAGLFARRLPWEVRRTGALGLAVTAGVVAAFLVSVMPADGWSVRYLGPIIWSAPLALAPAAWSLGTRRLGALMVPYLVAAAVNGWLGYGPYVRGPWPVRDPRGVAADEDRLGAELARLGVRHATADYWLAYRLSFLLHERLVVNPLAATDVRYGPYAQAFDSAPVVAYLFHPATPVNPALDYEADLRVAGVPLERREIAGFTVLLLPSTSFAYRDPLGTGRLTLVDVGAGPEPGSRRLRVTLDRAGVRTEGTGLRRELDRDRPFTAALSFTLGGPRGPMLYEGRTTSPFYPSGQGTCRRAADPATRAPWFITAMDRK